MIESQARFPQPITEEYLNDVAQTIADAITPPNRMTYARRDVLPNESDVVMQFGPGVYGLETSYFQTYDRAIGSERHRAYLTTDLSNIISETINTEILQQRIDGKIKTIPRILEGRGHYRPVTQEQHEAAVTKTKQYLSDWGIKDDRLSEISARLDETIREGYEYLPFEAFDLRREPAQKIMQQIHEMRGDAPFETIESREHGKIFVVPASNDMAVSFWKNKGNANDIRATISQIGADGERNVIARVVPVAPVSGDYLERREKAIAADRETNRLIGQIFETLFEREAKWLRAAKLVADLIKNLNNNREQGRHH